MCTFNWADCNCVNDAGTGFTTSTTSCQPIIDYGPSMSKELFIYAIIHIVLAGALLGVLKILLKAENYPPPPLLVAIGGSGFRGQFGISGNQYGMNSNFGNNGFHHNHHHGGIQTSHIGGIQNGHHGAIGGGIGGHGHHR